MKYPRTKHLMWSPEIHSDDKTTTAQELEEKIIGQEIIITQKMDGSNIGFDKDRLWSRSYSTPNHQSFDLIKFGHNVIKHNISKDYEIFGEWLYAVHSIKYDNLTSYFKLFNVIDKKTNKWLDWESICLIAEHVLFEGFKDVSITYSNDFNELIVPVLYQGKYESLNELEKETTEFFDYVVNKQQGEGLVIRPKKSFFHDSFSLFKMVRRGHVQTDEHWMFKSIEKQNLIKES